MALHFERTEFDARRDRLILEMIERKLEAARREQDERAQDGRKLDR